MTPQKKLRRADRFAIATALIVGSGAIAHADTPFTYDPPGMLVAGAGAGRVDTTIYQPGMRFPIASAPAFANSQVWGVGGSEGPKGVQSDPRNFAYPWHDNFCETRTYDMPLCPAGMGHQGQDIRAASAEALKYWAVAATDGTITSVGNYSVYLTDASGKRFDYLHMGNLQVEVGDKVARGQRVGMVSNEFNGTPTTIHLHFNIRENVVGVGDVYVPPYLSLVAAYESLLAGTADLVDAGPTEEAGSNIPPKPKPGAEPIENADAPIEEGEGCSTRSQRSETPGSALIFAALFVLARSRRSARRLS